MNEEMKLAWLEISEMLGEPTREELDVFLRTWQRASQATRKALAEQSAQQEPYCYVYKENGEDFFAPPTGYVPDDATPLYTSPPAQRTWVGLTDEEIEQGCRESWVTEQAWQSAVWWAEAKLKEKNT